MNFISQDWVSVVSLLFDVLGEVYFDHQTMFRIPQVRSSTSFTQCSNTYWACGLLGSWQSLRDPSSPQKQFPFLGTTMFTVCKVAYLKGACLNDKNLLGKGAIISTTGSPEVEEAASLGDSLAWFASSSDRLPTKGSELEEKRCVSSSGILEGERSLFQKPMILSGIWFKSFLS